MEADSPPVEPSSTTTNKSETPLAENPSKESSKSPNESCEEADSTIHGFNVSNVTVVEKKVNLDVDSDCKKIPQCEGSDSGVEVVENLDICVYQRNLSSNSGTSHDFENINSARSCDSSLISVCSNYEEAYNLLVRKNSTLLEDYGRNGDVTSENGSESSSISGSQSRNRRLVASGSKKKVSAVDAKNKSSTMKDRSRSKPPVTPRNSTDPVRLKSVDRLQGKPTQISKPNSATKSKTSNSLDLLNLSRKDSKRPQSATTRASSGNRTPSSTPTDDGRWPSINSKPAPLMARSFKMALEAPSKRISQSDTKTIEKYATLPRRRKDKTGETINKDTKKPNSRENTLNRISLAKKPGNTSKETTPSRMTSSLYLPRTKHKTKIYHEFSSQTALTMSDVEKALAGIAIAPRSPTDVEKGTKDVQVDISIGEIERLQERLKELSEKYVELQNEHAMQGEKLKKAENRLKEETLEKEGLREELRNNSQRVLAILGTDGETTVEATNSSDSLMVLETRFQNVGQVIVKQEEEISKLNDMCRSLQMELEKSFTCQRTLMQQQQDLEMESIELQEFMQAEKMTLHDALKESETELQKLQKLVVEKDKELEEKQDEYKKLARISEQRRQENLSLQARLGVLESKSRELLVQQGSSVSGAAVALSALIGRLDGLVEELVVAYSISDQELDDVIFHNEAYKNSSSSPDSTPEKSRKFIDKLPSPQKGSSFVSAVINAIKNAAHSPFARDISKDNLSTDKSSSNEMLDSETEPCLMMEHVLEDVVIPDGYSQNLISSGHGSLMSSRLTHSESLKDISQVILNRQSSWSCCDSLNNSYISNMASFHELFPSVSLVDQVIDVDNLITRLLKVIRIIQIENEDCMNELQEQRDGLLEQTEKQKDTNKMVVKQLKDWEILGARLRSEVKELMCQMSRKNMEIDNLKTELNRQREEVEKLNQDVCELSTALAKAELEGKMKEEEVNEEIKKWEKTGEMPAAEVLGRLISNQNEMDILKEKLTEKEKRLADLTQEFLASRQVLSESLKDALNESKKQYEAIDSALEVLHSIQSVVQQCPPLSKLQRDLEEINFQSASAIPLVTPSDCNANAGLLQAVANLEITPTINTTA